ncbi:hypothetical protein KUTeg_009825 [Tegillarca granosa]|uniref:Uncharacterized protein n=1 Tax=Tegillarca granosa TaxID=220873 RepID=A0ABQ9F834_TEGGR|nr:hypothetical protein KUTeg_009825 [Tegillarca granosa]
MRKKQDFDRACNIQSNNTLFIDCKTNKDGWFDSKQQRTTNMVRRYRHQHKQRYSTKDFVVTRKYRGIQIKSNTNLMKQYPERKRIRIASRRKLKQTKSLANINNDYNVNNTYAKFGWSFSVIDIDKDGNDDLIVGAPRYSEDVDAQRGRVYIIYGSDDGFPTSDFDSINVNNYPNITSILKGPMLAKSRFGSSVAALDINLDGHIDIAVGAPAFGNNGPLQYNGAVYIYLGGGKNRYFTDPNIEIKCQTKYCNLGHNLAVADTNFDGRDDLVLATPFFHQSLVQGGTVSSLCSNSDIAMIRTIFFEDLVQKWKLSSNQEYSWFGHQVRTKKNVLMINQPHCRINSRSRSDLSPSDIQNVGRLSVFNMGNELNIQNFTFIGSKEFQSLGYSSDVGFPYGKESLILAIGIPGASVNGSVFTVPFEFPQAGIVILYNITKNEPPMEVARFEGNRHYDRFGNLVKFQDVNGDNIDDLIIGSPLFTDDWSGIAPELIPEDGRVYIYYGGEHFLKGNVTRQHCNYKHIVYPCPGRQANLSVDDRLGYSSSRFGIHVEVIKTKNQRFLGFTAPYTNMENDVEQSGTFTLRRL